MTLTNPEVASTPAPTPTAGTTTVVERPPAAAPLQRRRPRRVPQAQALSVLGAVAAGLCTAGLLFGRIAPFSGPIGFVIVAYVIFLVAYAVLVSQTESGPAVTDAIATVLLYTAALGVAVALISVIVDTVVKGYKPLLHSNFFTSDLHSTQPFAPYTQGGVEHAIVGTLWTVAIALVITVPIGIAAAVWLSETSSRLAAVVRTVVNAMTALPDILAGLFIYAVWILTLGQQKSGLAAGLALAIMALPIIIRASDVVLRLVPGNLREAAAALGAPRWRSVWHVILPTARSGLATAVILGTARTIGETAPILLTAGYTTYLNTNPLHGPMVSLPLLAFTLVGSGLPPQVARGFAAATFLLLLVVVLFVVARVLGGRGPGQLSKRARRRAERRSEEDARRLASRRTPPEGAGHPAETRSPV